MKFHIKWLHYRKAMHVHLKKLTLCFCPLQLRAIVCMASSIVSCRLLCIAASSVLCRSLTTGELRQPPVWGGHRLYISCDSLTYDGLWVFPWKFVSVDWGAVPHLVETLKRSVEDRICLVNSYVTCSVGICEPAWTTCRESLWWTAVFPCSRLSREHTCCSRSSPPPVAAYTCSTGVHEYTHVYFWAMHVL